MKKILILICFCICSVSVFASRSFPTGNDIYETCTHLVDKPLPFKSKEDIMDRSMKLGQDIGMCYAAVGTAFSAVTEMGYLWSVGKKFAVCMEEYYGFDRFDGQQVLDMTLKYLKENPKDRDLPITALMADMLHDEFPSSVCYGAASKDRIDRK